MENLPTQEELNPIIKKRGFWQIIKKIALFVLPMVIKNQKGFKGTNKEKAVDMAVDVLEEL